MFTHKNENEGNKVDRIALLVGTIASYLGIFIITKIGILNPYLGAIIIIFLYMYMDFNLTNIFFSSKRTTFKIYIFMILEIMHFFMTAFSLMSILVYFIGIAILAYLMIIDEGKNRSPEIYRFLSIYTLIKIIFALTWIVFR